MGKATKVKTPNSLDSMGTLNSHFRNLKEQWMHQQENCRLFDKESKVTLLVHQLGELIQFLVTSHLSHSMYYQYQLPIFDESYRRILFRTDSINDSIKNGSASNNHDNVNDFDSKFIDDFENLCINGNLKNDPTSGVSNDNESTNIWDSFSTLNMGGTLNRKKFDELIVSKGHSYLNSKQLRELQNILWGKKEAFYEYDRKFGHYNGSLKMKLKIADGITFSSPNNTVRNINEELRICISIYNLLKEGIIELSNSSVLSSPKLIKNQYSKTQLAGNYTNVNKALQSLYHSVPSTFDTLQNIGCKRFYTVLKLDDPHYQIDIDEESRYLTAISTSFGNFQFKRVNYGLSESLNIVNQVVQSVYVGENTTIYHGYVVFSNDDVQSHLEFIKMALDKTKKFGLKLSLSDCSFIQDSFKNFGLVVNEEGIIPDKERILLLISKDLPKNTSELRSFLGSLEYYNRHFPISPSNLTLLFDALKSPSVPHNAKKAVEEIKNQLVNICYLSPPNYNESFVIFMHVSTKGTISVLLQNSSPIEFYSCHFEGNNQKFVDHKLAIDGLSYVLKKFSSYIYGKDVLIVTDSTNPISLMTIKNISNVKTSNKNFITSFNITIKYLKRSNYNLSVFSLIQKKKFDIEKSDLGSMEEVFPNLGDGRKSFFVPQNFKHFYSYQDKEEKNMVFRKFKNYRHCIFVPKVLRYSLLFKWHNSRKFGRHRFDVKAISEFKNYFVWFKMDKDIVNSWKYCNKCLLNKNPNSKLKKKSRKLPPSEPWDTLNVYVMTVSGPINLLVLIDDFCKFVALRQLSTLDNETVVSTIEECVMEYKEPKCIITDRSTIFENLEFKEMCHYLSIKHSPNNEYMKKFSCVLNVLRRLLEDSIIKFPDVDVKKRIEILEIVHNSRQNNQEEKSPTQLMKGIFNDLLYKTVEDYDGEDKELCDFFKKQLSC